MDSHNKKFSLYFKGREKSILARGEDSNYINDYPKDLYIYNYSTKSSSPLISYDWFPSQAKYFLQEYDYVTSQELCLGNMILLTSLHVSNQDMSLYNKRDAR